MLGQVGARYRLAVLRQIEQGNGEAQEAARDLIDDLQPSMLLVVGIAGGLPLDDIAWVMSCFQPVSRILVSRPASSRNPPRTTWGRADC